MVKMIAAVCRRPGMTHAEYIAYIHQVHAAISRENPVTLKHYVQNHVFDSAFGTEAEASHSMPVSRDSVTELFWDSFEAMGQTFAHPHVREKVGPDGRNFADLRASLSMVATEVEMPVRQSGPAGAKVMHFLRMAPGLTLDTFFERWASAHARVLKEEEMVALTLRRCVHNRQEPKANELLAYFNAEGAPPIYEGVGSLWYDNAASVGMFRTYERALLRINTEAEHRFYLPEQSFFVYANEVDVL